MSKFIRVFAHGLVEGDELSVKINKKNVVFTPETAQQDIEISGGSEEEKNSSDSSSENPA